MNKLLRGNWDFGGPLGFNKHIIISNYTGRNQYRYDKAAKLYKAYTLIF